MLPSLAIRQECVWVISMSLRSQEGKGREIYNRELQLLQFATLLASAQCCVIVELVRIQNYVCFCLNISVFTVKQLIIVFILRLNQYCVNGTVVNVMRQDKIIHFKKNTPSDLFQNLLLFRPSSCLTTSRIKLEIMVV